MSNIVDLRAEREKKIAENTEQEVHEEIDLINDLKTELAEIRKDIQSLNKRRRKTK